jgi:hypothetical protein
MTDTKIEAGDMVTLCGYGIVGFVEETRYAGLSVLWEDRPHKKATWHSYSAVRLIES